MTPHTTPVDTAAQLEEWKPVKGFEGLYEVSNLGRVKSLIMNTILSPCKGTNGYLVIGFRKNGKSISKRVHRMIAEAFIPNPHNKLQVNHINGIKADNRIENLEWCTNQENSDHAKARGLLKTGENHGSSKLTWKEVNEIRSKYKKHVYGPYRLAKEYGVGATTVSSIIENKTWKVNKLESGSELFKEIYGIVGDESKTTRLEILFEEKHRAEVEEAVEAERNRIRATLPKKILISTQPVAKGEAHE